ncbi:MAG: DDE transposase, partial [Puniceicoccaceae bacterium]|nr:DDE transposase [Puniceicoccaceae bacterium]
PQAIGVLRKWLNQPSACLLDGGYDSDAIREFIVQSSGTAVIPPNPTRASKIEYDKHLYKERHKVENLFQRLSSVFN